MNAREVATSRAYDVVVLGGGPAGAAAAISLRRRGIGRVLVVEAGGYDEARIGESVPPDIRIPMERDLGVWEAFLAEGHEPSYGSRSAWGGDRLGYNDSVFNVFGHGWHLDRTRFDAFLAREAENSGAEVATRTRFEKAAPLAQGGHELGYELSLAGPAGPMKVEARIVVDATGPRGAFARLQGAGRLPLDRLAFIAGFFSLAEASPLTRQTMLEAVEGGWWYAARLPGGRCVSALACDVGAARDERLTQSEIWLGRLRQTRHIFPALAASSLEDQGLRMWAAVSCLRDPVAGPDWLAVGDAACVYDPLSSQGIYKALIDGVEAAAAIAEARLSGCAISADYGRGVGERFSDYLAVRNYFYGQEQRWPDAPFWRNRRARTALAARLNDPRETDGGPIGSGVLSTVT